MKLVQLLGLPGVSTMILNTVALHCLLVRLYLVTSHLFKVDLSVQFVLFEGDSLRYSLGQKFSTRDQDNDVDPRTSCAVQYKGAWWYKDCHLSNLNGRYLRGSGGDRVTWYHWKSSNCLRYTEMKIRPF